MIKPEQIPVEAFKAGIDAWNSNLGRSYTASVREIIAAAINAWPQGWSLEENDTASIMETAGVFLPLPQENNDAFC